MPQFKNKNCGIFKCIKLQITDRKQSTIYFLFLRLEEGLRLFLRG